MKTCAPRFPLSLLCTCALILSFLPIGAGAQRGSRKAPVENNVQFAPPPLDVPEPADKPDYPLRVHLFDARYGGGADRWGGYGSGNLIAPAPTQGFEYSFVCGLPFAANHDAAEVYAARWIKQPYRLEILARRADGSLDDRCELRIALRPTPFDPARARALPDGPTLRVFPKWEPDNVPTFAPDPAYPVKLYVYSMNIHDDKMGEHHGRGSGRVPGDGPGEAPLHIDFRFDCNPAFVPNSQLDDAYQARWTKPNQQLEVMTRETGGTRTAPCRIDIIDSNPMR